MIVHFQNVQAEQCHHVMTKGIAFRVFLEMEPAHARYLFNMIVVINILIVLPLHNHTFLLLQKEFGGTACEKCAEDNLFGPNCTSGLSGLDIKN
ncbi:hypothetical protein JD844_028520 [Phrynosoma platyrhinos]|uniref:Uncharacterized protein n=1 Tax=Phrynosoma platyrhinos TaxID=52577 RepID=A0ABQ7SI29_PHRPL|nr:hypothetical protein JD844_028520 [Phrynosoma platyrhinos]